MQKMNKSFKSIWNGALGSYVAVAETSKAKGKGRNVVKNSIAAAVVALAAGGTTGALACNIAIGDDASNNASLASSCSNAAADTGGPAGSNAVAGGNGADNIAIGTGARANDSSVSTLGTGSVAIGYGASATSN